MDEVRLSVDRFCLLAGIEALQEMMEEDATAVCGARHRRHEGRRGYRWGTATSEIGYHSGKVTVGRPRVRDRAGKEVGLASWEVLRDGDLLREWAMNLMVLNVSTRKCRRAVRLPEGDVPGGAGDGTSKSAVSRRSLACTNIIENALGTVRQVSRNVKRWRHAEMALRWTAAGMMEAHKTFRRLKAYRQLPILRSALQDHMRKAHANSAVETIMQAA